MTQRIQLYYITPQICLLLRWGKLLGLLFSKAIKIVVVLRGLVNDIHRSMIWYVIIIKSFDELRQLILHHHIRCLSNITKYIRKRTSYIDEHKRRNPTLPISATNT